MYKITETYIDYDGNERTEDLYFNLSEAEVVKLMTTSGDYTLDKMLLRLSQKRNIKEIISIFENILYTAYGEKSLDGRRFVKTKEVKDNFVETEAYSKLFMRLVTDGKEAAKFISSIIPKELADDIEKVFSENPEGIPAEIRDYLPTA